MLILHLSDIHTRTNSRISLLPIFTAIKHEIVPEEILLIIISGDIAFSGAEEEYNDFNKSFEIFINEVKAINTNLKVELIMSPGNHDCNFLPYSNDRARQIIVKDVKENGIVMESKDDTSVISECTKIQKNFFDYLTKTSNIVFSNDLDKLRYKKTYQSSKLNIEVTCYNTAWLSELVEDPGSLYFPTAIFDTDENIILKDFIRIGVYHHPDNWLSPQHDESNHKDFKNHIARSHDLILSGHEHLESVSKYKDINNGNSCIYHESNAYHKDGNYGGFNLLKVNENSAIEAIYFEFDRFKNIFKENKILKHDSSSICNGNKNYKLNKDFKKYLNDNEIFLSSPTSKEIKLSDLFTFPKVEDISTNDLINSEVILSDDIEGNLIFFGADQSGKTAILKQSYLNYYYNGYLPIYIDGKKDITNMNVNQTIKNKYKKQYNFHNKDFDDYLNLPNNNKIIFIDNFHQITNKVDKKKFLEDLSGYSEHIILTADDISSLDETIVSVDSKIEFQKYTILPFGNVNREELIKKWFLFQGLEQDDLFEKTVVTHNRVSDIIGSNLVPSYPVFITTILQALESRSSSKNEITSYGHCYQTLIYLSFNKIGLPDDEFEVIDNFLTHFSFYLYKKGIKYITDLHIKEFLVNYCKKYVMTSSEDEVIEILTKSKILRYDSLGNYTFKYIYIYYYYVSKYIANYEINNKKLIEELCENIHIKSNSFIVLFLTHHSNDERVLSSIIFNSMTLFEKFDPIKLNIDETDFMTDIVNEATSVVMDHSIQPESYRKNELSRKDSRTPENTLVKDDISDVNKNLSRINKTFKSIEINGQILKNRYGSIDKDNIKHIIEESFLATFRMISYLVDDLSQIQTQVSIVDQVEEKLKKHNEEELSITVREKIFKVVSDVLNHITYYVCHYAIDKVSSSLGSKKLSELFDDVSDKIGTPAAEITNYLIKSKFEDKIDKNMVIKLCETYKNNTFAFSILKKATVNYIYMHKLAVKDKQWLAEKFEISVKGQRKMENKKNK